MNSLKSQTTPRINILSTERQHSYKSIPKQTPIQLNFPKTRFIEKAWKVGHYTRSSSFCNSNTIKLANRFTKDSIAPTEGILYPGKNSSLAPLSNEISPCVRSKGFHPNKQSPGGWMAKQSSSSMMNYQTLDYDPITHVKREPRPALSSHRQKGLCEFIDKAKLNNRNLNPSYQAAFTHNRNTFHRGAGEFSQYVDLCVKFSGDGPFKITPTLLKNK
jgi:hypothetical protein